MDKKYEMFLDDVKKQTEWLVELLLNLNVDDMLEFRIVGVEGQILPLIMKYGVDVYRRANRESTYRTTNKDGALKRNFNDANKKLAYLERVGGEITPLIDLDYFEYILKNNGIYISMDFDIGKLYYNKDRSR